jgi:hypothetical protein
MLIVAAQTTVVPRFEALPRSCPQLDRAAIIPAIIKRSLKVPRNTARSAGRPLDLASRPCGSCRLRGCHWLGDLCPRDQLFSFGISLVIGFLPELAPLLRGVVLVGEGGASRAPRSPAHQPGHGTRRRPHPHEPSSPSLIAPRATRRSPGGQFLLLCR